MAPDQLHVDTIVGIDERSFYIRGWIRHPEAKTKSLTAISPEGHRIELLDKVFVHPRPDVQKFYNMSPTSRAVAHGFISYFQTTHPSFLSEGWRVEMCYEGGTAVQAEVPAAVRALDTEMAEAIIGDLALERAEGEGLILNHIFPAISRILDNRQRRVEVAAEEVYGSIPDTPRVSIIIPLYQRLDFLEVQLAHFVQDPEVRDADLIYVLDSPELADDLRDRALKLSSFYQIPFRLIFLKQN
jgi:hypothetical protein